MSEGRMKPMNWKCPYCGHAQTVTDATYDQSDISIYNNQSKYGEIGGRVTSIVCSNSDCKEITLWFSLRNMRSGLIRTSSDLIVSPTTLREWLLLPESSAKPQPGYIPEPVLKDYRQACRIRDLCPNASATMARRCLQGMIRDFCKIKKSNLKKEIDHLKKLVQEGKGPHGVNHAIIVAIDNIREIGNIGAHMEKDINLILDVEPDEAQALIALIEILFEEWYVARDERERKLKRLEAIAGKKKSMKEEARPSLPDDQQAESNPDRG